jgi:hypothetical protein
MPRDNTTLKSQLSSANVPTRTVATGGAAQVVTVTLNFTGNLGYRPIDVITALESQYGAGKVSSARDAQPPYGTLDLQINP